MRQDIKCDKTLTLFVFDIHLCQDKTKVLAVTIKQFQKAVWQSSPLGLFKAVFQCFSYQVKPSAELLCLYVWHFMYHMTRLTQLYNKMPLLQSDGPQGAQHFMYCDPSKGLPQGIRQHSLYFLVHESRQHDRGFSAMSEEKKIKNSIRQIFFCVRHFFFADFAHFLQKYYQFAKKISHFWACRRKK